MTTGSFPTDPCRRKAILVLQKHDIEKCAYEPEAAETLLDEEVYILPYPDQNKQYNSIALQNIYASGLASPGSVLIQSPFDPDNYEEATLATQRFALEKHMYFSKLCLLLGAKQVIVEQIDLQTRSTKLSINANGEITGKKEGVELESSELENLRSQMDLCDNFTGGIPDIQAAENLLRKNGIWSDPSMRNLVEMRREGANQLLSRKLTLNLSSESKKNLKVIGNLALPKFIKLSADYNKVISQQLDYTLTVLVKF